jgi:hypothetical protein
MIILAIFIFNILFVDVTNAQSASVDDFNTVSYLNDLYTYRKAINGSALPIAGVLVTLKKGLNLFGVRNAHRYAVERVYAEILSMYNHENITVQVGILLWLL